MMSFILLVMEMARHFDGRNFMRHFDFGLGQFAICHYYDEN